jgi:hypothetical protein
MAEDASDPRPGAGSASTVVAERGQIEDPVKSHSSRTGEQATSMIIRLVVLTLVLLALIAARRSSACRIVRSTTSARSPTFTGLLLHAILDIARSAARRRAQIPAPATPTERG